MTTPGYNPGAAEDPTTSPDIEDPAEVEEAEEVEPDVTEATSVGDVFPTE